MFRFAMSRLSCFAHSLFISSLALRACATRISTLRVSLVLSHPSLPLFLLHLSVLSSFPSSPYSLSVAPLARSHLTALHTPRIPGARSLRSRHSRRLEWEVHSIYWGPQLVRPHSCLRGCPPRTHPPYWLDRPPAYLRAHTHSLLPPPAHLPAHPQAHVCGGTHACLYA